MAISNELKEPQAKCEYLFALLGRKALNFALNTGADQFESSWKGKRLLRI